MEQNPKYIALNLQTWQKFSTKCIEESHRDSCCHLESPTSDFVFCSTACAKVKGRFCIGVPLLSVQWEPRVLPSPPNVCGTVFGLVVFRVRGTAVYSYSSVFLRPYLRFPLEPVSRRWADKVMIPCSFLQNAVRECACTCTRMCGCVYSVCYFVTSISPFHQSLQ